MQNITGLYTALITPFDAKGELDEEGLRQNIRYQLDSQVDGIVVLGTTGEAPTLTEQEKVCVLRIAKEEVSGKSLLIAGAGSYSTKQTIENSRLAEGMGANALLVVTPFYNKPTQEGIFQHFKAVAGAVSIPIILYNHPGRCGASISIETMQRLAEISNIIGVKEASDDIMLAQEIIGKIPNFSILSGNDPLTLPLVALGGHGVISIASNLVPGEMKSFVDKLLRGDFTIAREEHYHLLPLFQALVLETNPIPIKAAMQLSEMAAGQCRLPLSQLDPKHLTHLKNTVNKYTSPLGIHG